MRAGGVRPEPTPVQARPPLVGRDAERADLVEAVVGGRHLLIEGPAGVGKSRIAEEVVSAPELRHRALDRLLACAGTSEVALAAMLPLIAGRVTHDGLGSQLEWYLGRWRSRRNSASPTLVWLDDAHHLDEVSAALIRQAVTSGDIQLFGTARVDEAVPDDLVALLVDGTVGRVHLLPLDPAASRRLATLCTPTPTSATRAERIARLAAGYPLFVRELALSPDPGTLPPDGPGRAVLRARLDRLPAGVRRAAELVALAQPVPAALLEHRAHQLEVLRRDGLLVTHEVDLVRLDHPLQTEWLVHGLGAARVECYRELVERATAAPGLVDPLLVLEWQLGARQRLVSAEAARAVRLALARTDLRAARRLLAHVAGQQRELLLGQTLAIEGDLDRGLELLERVRAEASDPALRVEAASLLVRHLGLTRNDPARAHEVLDRTDTPELDVRLRRHLLLGRLWLRLFGPDLGPRITPEDELLRPGQEDDQLAYDLATSSAALFCQAGVDRAAPLLERALTIERKIDVDEGSWCRTRAVEACLQLFGGDLAAARATIAAGARRAWEQGWQEGFWLLAGNAGVVAGLAGQLGPYFLPPGWDHRTLEPAGSTDEDLYRFKALGAAAWKTCCVLADPSGSCPCQRHRLADSAGTMPLLDVLVARAEDLAAAGRGATPSDASLPTALVLLSENDLLGWLATFYLDGCDLRSPPGLHRLVTEQLDPAATGLFALARETARARVDGDGVALLGAGSDLAARGFLVPATRAFADVTRLHPDAEIRLQAVRGLAASDTRWQGAPMPWIGDVEGMPTRRQLEIVRAVTGGATVQAVADQWCLSRRTVENHVYRVARCLEADSRDQLGEMLIDPCPELATTATAASDPDAQNQPQARRPAGELW